MRLENSTVSALVLANACLLFGFTERVEGSVELLDEQSELFSSAAERQRLDRLKQSGLSTEDAAISVHDAQKGSKPIEFKGYISNGSGRVLMYRNNAFNAVSDRESVERKGSAKPPTLTVLEGDGRLVELKVGQVYSRQ